MKEPQITLTVNGSPHPISATVDTGSPISFFRGGQIKVPSNATRGLYTIGGKTWRGWYMPARVKLAEGCEITREVFVAPKAKFSVLGTDVLQGLGCRINLKTDRLVCPPGKAKGCSIVMTEPHSQHEPSGKTGRRKAPKRRR